ncbi:MAG: MBL fold metallo-hydrolase [Rhodospirillaceae bacterium]|nr:MBL fold metallo-hydrolase [Rhodospirillaceae bacterium]
MAIQSTSVQSWRIGEMTVSKVVDMIEPFDAARAYPEADLAEFDRHLDWLTPYFYDPAQRAIILSFHSYVVKAAGKVIVVDTCIGEHKNIPMLPSWHQRTGPWLANLAAAGVVPEQVTHVMCTHLHGDHVGWNTRLENGRWVPTFPNARYIVHKDELAAVQARVGDDPYTSPSYAESVLPVLYAKQVDLVATDHEFLPGVHVRPTPGHSPGHYCVELASAGRRAVMTGDLIHNPVQIARPDWITTFCTDKQAAVAQRTRFIDAHADQDVTIFAAHFGGPTAGRIASRAGARRFQVLT